VEVLRHAPIMAFVGLLVSVAPLVMGVIFALGPNERRLALMRPLSLAAIFAGLSNLLLGAINVLRGLEKTESFDSASIRGAIPGTAEAIALTLLTFACLTVAWLCVAIGMRKLS
jgi:hypothetical protein